MPTTSSPSWPAEDMGGDSDLVATQPHSAGLLTLALYVDSYQIVGKVT